MDMTRRDLLKSASAVGALVATGGVSAVAAQFGLTPEEKAKQDELEKSYQVLQVTDEFLRLAVPGYTMGQTVGIALNSKGHLFVYSRSNPKGIARGGQAAMLWEFDENHQFVKEWGPNNYAASFAHAVRVDKDDNVWQVDEGSGMIIKYDSNGQSIFWLGRTPEAIDYLETNLEHDSQFANLAGPPSLHPVGRVGEFNRPTDVTWDSAGNIYISDGYGNSRVVKISPNGKWLKEVGTYGTGQDQFRTPHSIVADAQDNIYVADRGNNRIQVYDTDLNYKKTITGVAMPWDLSVTNTSPQYLFCGDGMTGKLYKVDMSGKVVGMCQTSLGRGADDTGDLIHSVASPTENVVYLGSASMWDVQKVTIS